MKTPDSGPRFRSATRQYHHYREENHEGWNNWVDGKGKPPRFKIGGRLKWTLVIVGALGVASLLGAVFVYVF